MNMGYALACHNLLYRLLTIRCETERVGADAAWYIKKGTLDSQSFVISGGATARQKDWLSADFAGSFADWPNNSSQV
jgi:hypothetical protein